jgi:nucleotide sugar dehydrogenase
LTSAQRIAAFEARLRARDPGPCCAVIGLGFIGSTLMDALRASRIEAHAFDRDRRAVARYAVGRDLSLPEDGPRWSVGSDEGVLERADVVLVAVRAPIDSAGRTDLEPLESAAGTIRALPRRPRLVAVVSTLPPGTTRRFATWCREGGADVFVVHSPERLSVGHDWRMLRRIPHLVGGVDEASSRLGAAFLGRVCETIVPVAAPEVSELSKLLENAFITVGVGLIAEVTRIAHALGVTGRDVTDAAATKPFGYHAFHPGPGVGGHCLPNDLKMLGESARSLGWEAALLEATARVTAAQPRLVVDRAQSVLAAAGQDLRGARVLIVGMGFKAGTADTTATPAEEIVRELRRRRAQPFYVDSRVASFAVDGEEVPRIDGDRLDGETFPIALVLAGDPALRCAALAAAARAVVDAGGGAVLSGGPLEAHRL